MLETIIDTAHRGNRALILFILFGKLREYYAFETFFSKANCGFFFQTSVASSIKPIWLLDYFISFYVGCISFEEPDDLSIYIQFNNADFNSVNQFASDAMQNIRFILKHKKL